MSFTEDERNWLDEHFENIRREVFQLRIDVEKLKVKASIWGALGGGITVLITACIYLLRGV